MGPGQKTKTKTYCYDFPMVSVTVDCVIFGWDNDGLHVLLIERGEEPFEGQWALPGGFIRAGEEDLEKAARRELSEETGIGSPRHLEQLGTYGHPDRDPREEHVITVAYIALIKRDEHRPQGGTDARSAHWIPMEEARRKRLAFDHDQIFSDAVERLYNKLRYDPLGFNLLRVAACWADLEVEEGKYFWDELDALLVGCAERGIEVRTLVCCDAIL